MLTTHTRPVTSPTAKILSYQIPLNRTASALGTRDSRDGRPLRTDARRVGRAGQTRPEFGDGDRFGAEALEAPGRVDAGKSLHDNLADAFGAVGVLENV